MTQCSAERTWRAHTLMAVAAVGLAVSGCGVSSLTSGLSGSVFGEKSSQVPDVAGGVSEEQLLQAAKADASAPGATVTGGISPGCPKFTVSSRDGSITFYEAGRAGDGLAIMQRGEITKTARECRVEGGQVIVKYGFSGRVLLGPRGQSGTVTLPINIAVTDSQHASVAADSLKIPVAVALDKPIGYFSAVREVTIPVAEGSRPGEYELTVSFDKKTAGAS